jgi:hypothetical protein
MGTPFKEIDGPEFITGADAGNPVCGRQKPQRFFQRQGMGVLAFPTSEPLNLGTLEPWNLGTRFMGRYSRGPVKGQPLRKGPALNVPIETG